MYWLFLFLLFPFAAMAGTGVMSPYVSGGISTFDTDGFYTFDGGDNTLRTRLTYDNGVSDGLMLRIRASAQDNRQDRYNYDNIELGAKYAFAPPGKLALDFGLYGGIIIEEEDKDQTLLSTRWLAGKRFGPWQHHAEILLTTSFQEQFGDTTIGFRARSQYVISPTLMVGGEYFSSAGTLSQTQGFRDTEQRLGPFVRFTSSDRQYTAEFTALPALNARTENLMLKWRIGTRF